MKKLLLALLLAPLAHAADPALDIPLIQTQAYNPTHNQSRGWDQFTDSIKLELFGNIYKATAMNVREDILKELKSTSASYYFTESELNALAARAATRIEKDILAPGVSNDTAAAAYNYGVNEIVGAVIRRVMEREGVADKTRTELWSKRILGTFNSCMTRVRSYTETQGCLSAFTSDIQKNIGLAMAHELARQELGPKHSQGRAAEYVRCLRTTEKGADARVKPCVLQTMRTGIIALTREKVLESAAELGEKTAKGIQMKVMPDYQSCIAKAGDRAAIAACVDGMTVRTGKEIVRETVLRNKPVLDAFSAGEERGAIVSAAVNDFEACMRKNIQANKREPNGQIITKNCEEFVTLSVAKKVLTKVFKTSIEQNHGGSPVERKAMFEATRGRLDACWQSDPKSCVRTTSIQLAVDIADARLKRDIPEALQKAEPAFQRKLLANLEGCLKKNLPEDLIKSGGDANTRIDACSSQLIRDAALKVADFQIRTLLDSRIGSNDTSALVDELVLKQFKGCLGNNPTPLRVDECSIELRRQTGIEAGRRIFAKEFDKFVQERGGTAALELPAGSREAFLGQLQESHERCLNEKVTVQNAANSERGLDECYKASIRKLAVFLGGREFERNLKKYIEDPNRRVFYTGRFDGEFGNCLDEKKGAEASLDNYVSHVNVCGDRLTHSFTRELGKVQLREALRQHLGGADAESGAARDRLSENLTAKFDECMDSIRPEEAAGEDICTRALTIDATREIVITAGRIQLKKELGENTTLPLAVDVENTFKRCMTGLKSGESTDGCVKSYIKDMARAIGGVKLHQAMFAALGDREYSAASDKLRKLEQDFGACLDGIQDKKVDNQLMVAVNSCTTKLQSDAVALLQGRIENWMAGKNDDEATRRAKEQLSIALPCFDGLVPTTSTAGEQVNAEGILQELSRIIGEYVAYDAARAEKDLTQVLAHLAKDLEAAGSLEARRNLIQHMARQGVLDQLLKSFIRAEVRETLTGLPKDQRLAEAVEKKLLEPATFDKVFNGEPLERLRPLLAKTILEPLLLEGKSLSSPELKAAQNVLKRDVAANMLRHPEFGQLMLDSFVQQGIDKTGGVSRFFGEIWYGSKAFKWDHIKGSTHGQAAETYIREQILKPKFLGEQVSESEYQKRLDNADKLVRTAVENYKTPPRQAAPRPRNTSLPEREHN